MLFTHLLACPCGSIKRGQRLENCVITPFSTERLSRGRPLKNNINVHVITRIIKNIFNKNERCRDIKTQKACEQGWEANIGPNTPLPYNRT